MAIPLAHCLDEYIGMFSLTSSDLKLAILDCAGGAASFNAEMNRQGQKVISCDRDYQFTAGEIRAHLPEYHTFINGFDELSKDYFRWNYFESPNHLGEVRMKATEKFLEDFPSGFQEGRYMNESLPDLPFENDQFDLALCSHFLFTYSHLSEKFHLEAITEMCRVAKQVRVFPLLRSYDGMESEHLNPIVTELRNRSFHVEEPQKVRYEFQIGGNKMLRVSKKSSA